MNKQKNYFSNLFILQLFKYLRVCKTRRKFIFENLDVPKSASFTVIDNGSVDCETIWTHK
jgi:hypothetical protein